MNLSLFSTLLRNLLHASIVHIRNDRTELLRFEEMFRKSAASQDIWITIIL